MAQTIVTICDACLADGTERQAEPYRFAFAQPGLGFRRILTDLCAEHAGPILTVWETVLEVGRPDQDGHAPAKEAPAGEPVLCPICGKALKSRGSLSAHTRGQHNTPLGELSGRRDAPKGERLSCPVCGQEFDYAQGLGRHVSALHSVSLAEARARASEASARASAASRPAESGKARRRARGASETASESE